jgi:hypothetical protein
VKNSFLILLVWLCGACVKSEEPPVGIIPKDTMAHILADIHIEEAKLSVKPLIQDSARQSYATTKIAVYDKYHISEERFNESFDWYTKNIEQLDKIYEVVVDTLSLKETRGKLD